MKSFWIPMRGRESCDPTRYYFECARYFGCGAAIRRTLIPTVAVRAKRVSPRD